MKLHPKGLALAIRAALGIGATLALAASGGALAQTQPQKIEKIEVTGSNIKRVDTETPAAVQVITREDIERSGTQTLSEVLAKIPANNTGTFNEAAVASFSPGAASVSLRGLGAGSTLILVNGRRVTPYGFASGGQTLFVDVNSIPLAAVERVEVLLDGASALYGSEAVAGVINIILRKDYRGAEARLTYGETGLGDANTIRAGGSFGHGDLGKDRFNFIVTADYFKRDGVLASARPLTETADYRRLGTVDRRSTFSYPGNLYAANGLTFLQTLAGCEPLNDPSAPALNGRCVYDFAQYTDLVPDAMRGAVLFSGRLALSGATELFADASFTQNEFKQRSPSYSTANYFGIGTAATANIVLPVGHPQNPTGEPVTLRYRFADVPFTVQPESATQRFVFGARTSLGAWDLESAILYSRSDTDLTYRGLIRDSVLYTLVADPYTQQAIPGFVFGNPGANAPGLIDALYPVLKDSGKTSITSFDVRGSAEVATLPAGPLAVAVGADLRRETFSSVPDPLLEAGEISVLGSASASGSRNVTALYGELSVPILKGLEGQVALRTDHYSDYGSSTTPKLGVKWAPTKLVALRGTYSEGFRAPSLTETKGAPTRGFYNQLRDPLLCPDPTDQNNPNCALSVEATFGSNPDLKAEESKSYTVGVVLEPIAGSTLSVDWYRIRRNLEISSLDPEYLLANEATYPGLVVRDPVTQELQRLDLRYINIGGTEVEGWDIEAKTKIKLGAMGALNVTALYNRLPKYLYRPTPDAPETDYAGTWMQPKERGSLTASWQREAWTVSLTHNYVGGYLRAYTPQDLSCPYTSTTPGLCSISSWSTLDLGVQYKGIKNLELALNVLNIEDKNPPLDQRRETRFTWYNPSFHNPLGRYILGTVKYKFK